MLKYSASALAQGVEKMAKQNFLAGGYYGKLGVTVGQRWKNIRTIRAYVVPANPRTEKQQANRGVFANAVTKAQLAMSMNFYATCFEHANMSRWNYRMRVARNLKDAGALDMDLIPLYPMTLTPPYLITKVSIAGYGADNVVNLAVEGTLPQSDRVLSVLFHLYSREGEELGYKLYVGNYSTATPNVISVQLDSASELNENCFVRIVSRDDVDSATDLVGSAQIRIGASGKEVRDFDTSVISVQKGLSSVTVVFNEPYRASDETTFSGSVYAISAGSFVTVQGSDLSLTEQSGYFAVTIPCNYTYNQQVLAFPEGAKITVDSISAIGGSFEYTKENDEIPFDDDDLTRQISSGFSFDSTETELIRVNFPLAVSGTTAVANCGLKCSGRLTDTSELTVATQITAKSAGVAQIAVAGEYASYPMLSGDYLRIAPFSVVSGGVTYQLASAETVNVMNSIRKSDFLKTRVTTLWEADSDDSDAPFYTVAMIGIQIGISGFETVTAFTLSSGADSMVQIGSRGSESVELTTEGLQSGKQIAINFYFDDSYSYQLFTYMNYDVAEWYLNYNGIQYYLDTDSLPQQLGDIIGW